MLFNSFGFLAFFSVLVPVYYLLPHKYRWPLLLAASLFFYAALRVDYVWLLIGVSVATYGFGLGLAATDDRRTGKGLLAAAVVTIIGPLIVFKYFDFFSESLDALLVWSGVGGGEPMLPRLELAAAAGLSFYTLSSISYIADVHRGVVQAERHLGRLMLYLAFFPKLLAGPIERARPFLSQVRTTVSFDAAGVTSGLQLMLWGLFKKVVIADRLAVFVDTAYRLPGFTSPADLVLATYFFAFQLYCDFSGYSDIAIGAARVLGVDLMENFRRPYFSTSVREFWAGRWHLSLATWFRDYLYIPMGGNRVSRPRQALNLMIVFGISGLWHGANWTFVVWGGLNGLYQVIALWLPGSGRSPTRADPSAASYRSQPIRSVLQAIVTFHLILFTWVFFRAATLADAFTVLSRSAASIALLPSLLGARLTTPSVLVALALIAVLLTVEALDERRPFWERLRAQPIFIRWAVYYAMVFSLIVLGTWNVRQFVYMQF